MSEEQITAYIQKVADSVSPWEFQQRPKELASLITYLKKQSHRITNYLEIGAGSGMVAKVLDELLNFERLHLVDNNYYDFAQELRKQRLPQAAEWVGDSQSEACAIAVAGWDVKFDLILVDGEHNYKCAKSDTLLAVSVAADPAYIAFHDKTWPGVHEWLDELRAGAVTGLTETPWTSWPTALFHYNKTGGT